MSKTYEVEVTGTVPLLMHRYDVAEHSEGVSKKKIKVFSEKEDAEKSCYRTKKGELFMPNEWFYSALIKAAKKQKYERMSNYGSVFKSGIVVEPEEIILDNQKYEIDLRAVVVRATGGRSVRARPKFNKWSGNFKVIILDEDLISPQVLKEALDHAGQNGVGDYRPRFGRFLVSKFKEIKN